MDFKELLLIGAGVGLGFVIFRGQKAKYDTSPDDGGEAKEATGFSFNAECSDIVISDPALAGKWFVSASDEIIVEGVIEPLEVVRLVFQRAAAGCGSLDTLNADGAKKAYGLSLDVAKRLRKAGKITEQQEDEYTAKAKEWANAKGAGIT